MADTQDVKKDQVQEARKAVEDEWVKAVKRQPMLQKLPAFVKPGEFTVRQSMDFDQLYTFARAIMNRYGKVPDDVKDPMRFTLMQEAAFNQLIDNADRFFKSIARDKGEYARWTTGHSAGVLSDAFLSLMFHYMGQLGK